MKTVKPAALQRHPKSQPLVPADSICHVAHTRVWSWPHRGETLVLSSFHPRSYEYWLKQNVFVCSISLTMIGRCWMFRVLLQCNKQQLAATTKVLSAILLRTQVFRHVTLCRWASGSWRLDGPWCVLCLTLEVLQNVGNHSSDGMASRRKRSEFSCSVKELERCRSLTVTYSHLQSLPVTYSHLQSLKSLTVS